MEPRYILNILKYIPIFARRYDYTQSAFGLSGSVFIKPVTQPVSSYVWAMVVQLFSATL